MCDLYLGQVEDECTGAHPLDFDIVSFRRILGLDRRDIAACLAWKTHV